MCIIHTITTTTNSCAMKENKNERANAPTPQRPGEPHLLDAPLIQIDVPRFSWQLKSEETWKTSDRNAVTLCKMQALRVVLMGLHQGAELKEHTANGTLSLQVLEGEIEFSAEGKSLQLTQGQIVCVQKSVPHAVSATQESLLLLTLAGSSPQEA